MFAFTSLGGKIDNSINRGKDPKIFKLRGENYHLIGSLKPPENNNAKFLQLYIHDTQNEVENRITALRYHIAYILNILTLVQQFFHNVLMCV